MGEKKSSPFTKFLLIAAALFLVAIFSLFNVGITVAYGVHSLIWGSMSTRWFWAITLVVSLSMLGIIYRVLNEREYKDVSPDSKEIVNEEKFTLAFRVLVIYLAINGAVFVLQMLLYFIFGGDWFRNIFINAFPFLSGTPVLP